MLSCFQYVYGVNKGNIGKTIIAYWIALVLCSAKSDYNHVVLTTGLNSNTVRVTDHVCIVYFLSLN